MQFELYLRILGKICTWIVIVLEMEVIYFIEKYYLLYSSYDCYTTEMMWQ
jgi:hypothetical protein